MNDLLPNHASSHWFNFRRQFLPVLFWIQTIFFCTDAIAQSEAIKHRVYLAANTADIGENAKIYAELQAQLAAHPEPFSLIINGDLIAAELTNENIPADSAKIRKLLETAASCVNGKAIIIPGDRDWADSGKEGLQSVKQLERLIAAFDFKNVQWAIKDGCLGPKAVEFDDNILLITINTQWRNHPYDKPEPADADCKISVDENFMEELEDLIEENADKNVLISGHFPIFSLGEYGGHLPLKTHLLPLPIIGGFFAGYRQNVSTPKDLANARFEIFRKRMEGLITSRRNLIYLSGHEHNLQILKKITITLNNAAAL